MMHWQRARYIFTSIHPCCYSFPSKGGDAPAHSLLRTQPAESCAGKWGEQGRWVMGHWQHSHQCFGKAQNMETRLFPDLLLPFRSPWNKYVPILLPPPIPDPVPIPIQIPYFPSHSHVAELLIYNCEFPQFKKQPEGRGKATGWYLQMDVVKPCRLCAHLKPRTSRLDFRGLHVMAKSSLRYPTSTLVNSSADRGRLLAKWFLFYFLASVASAASLEVNICKELKSLMYLTLQADHCCLLTKHF